MYTMGCCSREQFPWNLLFCTCICVHTLRWDKRKIPLYRGSSDCIAKTKTVQLKEAHWLMFEKGLSLSLYCRIGYSDVFGILVETKKDNISGKRTRFAGFLLWDTNIVTMTSWVCSDVNIILYFWKGDELGARLIEVLSPKWCACSLSYSNRGKYTGKDFVKSLRFPPFNIRPPSYHETLN